MSQERRKAVESDEYNKISNKRLKSNMFSSFYSRKSNKEMDVSFSQKKCTSLFNNYASKDDKNVIGPEGIESFCQDINLKPEDVVFLVLAWKMECKQMGYFTLKEWLKAFTELQCDSLNKIKNKIDYLRSLLNDPVTFKSIFRYSFSFSKESNQKNLDKSTARIMLRLLLENKWSLFEQFDKFLSESNHKNINEDQWCNILEFSKVITPDFKNYDEDGAWPLLMDEFVDWYKNIYS